MAVLSIAKPSRPLLLAFAFIIALALLVASVPVLSAAAFDGPTDAPNFIYETTFDGATFDSGRDIVFDTQGNAFVLAYAYTQGNDVLVLKVSPTGEVLWSTTIQGNSLDYGTGIDLDPNRDVFITGWTDSSNFPVVNGWQSASAGLRDAFLTQLSAQDGSILFSTYFGGDRSDAANDIDISPTGEIALIGTTSSPIFPTVNPIQGNLNTSTCFCDDAFVTKVAADLSGVVFSTYLGGGFDDSGVSIAIDGSGNLSIAGDTRSEDFPLLNPAQASYGGGFRDAFAARISGDSETLEYSTYLGAGDWDRVGRVDLDGQGAAYIAGTTQSTTFPTTSGAYQEDYGGGVLACGSAPYALRNCTDAFLTKVAADGSVAFSTYLGGNRDEEGRGVSVDAAGIANLIGFSTSTDFPPGGNSSPAMIYVAALNAAGSDLEFALTVESPVANSGHGIAADDQGDIFITGAKNVPSDVYVAKLGSQAPPTENTLHVGDIEFDTLEVGERIMIQAMVPILDQDDGPVGGADVTVLLSRSTGRKMLRTSTTNDQGEAFFSQITRNGGAWMVCVENVQKSGSIYDPGQNIETCDSFAYPSPVEPLSSASE